MQKTFSGLSFHWAMIFFLAAIFLLPIVMTADLIQASLQAEKRKIAGEFFAELAGRLADKRMAMIKEVNAPMQAFLALASDTLLAAGDETRFQEVAVKARQYPSCQGLALLASGGVVLVSSGTIDLGLFQEMVKKGTDPFLVCNEGYGVKTGLATEAPYLCLASNVQQHQIDAMKRWGRRMEADPEFQLYTLTRDPDTGKWRLKSPTQSGLVASFVPPVELPETFDPSRLEDRTRVIETASGPIGLVAESIAPEAYFVLTSSARGIEAKYRAFLHATIAKVLASALYVVILGALFSSLMGVPIRKLADACDQIESGSYEIEAPRSVFLEIDRFGKTFNRMASRVGTRIEAANQELMEQHGRLKALFEGVGDAIYLLDTQFRVILGNAPARHRLNLHEIPAVGAQLDDSRRTLLEKILQTENGTVAEFHEPLENTWNKLTVSRLIDYLGNNLGYVVVERDITLEREIDRMKSEFVSNVSHELRTPLTSIQAYAEMLVDNETSEPEQTREYLGIILAETERLTRLINDVLDLSRIESGRQIVKKVSVNLAEVAHRSAQIMEKWAQKKRLEWVVRVSRTEKHVLVDRDMIEQAMLNLLSNAIKYTPEGGRVEIDLAWSRTEAIFRVTDTGIGLSPAEKDKLFSKFFRAENETVKRAGGTGLGLVLVGEILRLHQGAVRVESTPGKGSSFEIRLPLPNGPDEADPAGDSKC